MPLSRTSPVTVSIVPCGSTMITPEDVFAPARRFSPPEGSTIATCEAAWPPFSAP